MSTRHAQAGAPLHDNRYMSAPEFALIRGINAVAVSARAAMIDDREVRELIWYVQGKSIEEGGVRKLAAALESQHPDRCRSVAGRSRLDRREPQPLQEFLVELCINPRILIGEDMQRKIQKLRLKDTQPDQAGPEQWLEPEAPTFKDILGALRAFKANEEKRIPADFVLTENCKPVWECLDFSARTRSITLINGAEGRGKTEAARAWCASHLGLARFVSLKAVSNKTTAFREIGRAIGIGAGLQVSATDSQAKIEEVLSRSKLLLCIDEAHWLFNQGQRISTRPELVDWIGTLSNDRVPICLVTTPQFLTCMERAARRVSWNYMQFRRRIKRYKVLGDTSPQDLKKVAAHLLPGCDAAGVKLAVGYAIKSRRDLSGLADVVLEAKEQARTVDAGALKFEHVDAAIRNALGPSDDTFKLALENARNVANGRKQPRNLPVADLLGAELPDENSGTEESEFSGRGIRPATPIEAPQI